MAPARPRALSTRLQLLLEVHDRRHTRLRTLAERLDVTVQAVSEYLKRLSNDGLVESIDGVWRPTKRGTAYLHETMRDLQAFLRQSMGSLQMVTDTYALADHRIRPEQDVGLAMRDGRLHAVSPRAASSRGRARTAAEAGHLVLVGDLKGVLDLRPATITLVAHPDYPTGPALERGRKSVRKLVDGRARVLVAVHDLASLAWVWALGLEADLEFAPTPAARAAAQRGVPVVYFVPEGERAAAESQLRPAGSADDGLEIRSVAL